MLISILTGFAAGAVHVVSGADHMVAMAPSAIQKPRVALMDGLGWGMGGGMGGKSKTGRNTVKCFAGWGGEGEDVEVL